MKTLFPILLISIFCISCNSSEKKAKEKEEIPLVFTMPQDSIQKATAIIWVDKKALKNHDRQKTRGAKAKVNVTEDGKITIIAFVKNYPKEVQNYIKHKLVNFRIDEEMMQNYIKPGEQFLQLRYSPYVLARRESVYK